MSNNKKFVVEANFIREACNLNLSLMEFLLLLYFENADDPTFDLDIISKKLKVNKDDLLNAFNSLLQKKVISLVSEKNELGKICDKISLDGFYQNLTDAKKKEENKKVKDDIFTKFEKEFRRPLNGTEFEVIKAWLEKMYNEDLILKALEEAVYNGATSIRYIDTILYEWNKKGFKTKNDVKKGMENRSNERNIELFDYNWLDEE